jgi:RNA polymerase sigma factor (sigma-70 family)
VTGEPEAALVAACARGDRAAWERFVVRVGPLLAALARRMLARRRGFAADADVDDVVSAVFLALVADDRKLLHRYRSEFRLSTYLGVICRTEVGRHARRSARAVSLDATEEGPRRADPRAADPFAALARSEREEAVLGLRAALAALAARDRLLLTLRFIDGLDYVRIGAVLGVAPDSVGQLLHRAKVRLAEVVPHLAHWAEGP